MFPYTEREAFWLSGKIPYKIKGEKKKKPLNNVTNS